MKWIADVDNSAISSRAQIRLLNNTFIRLVFSFTAVPFVGIPFAIWIYWLGNTGPTLVWIVIYLLCAGLIRIWHRRYQREIKENNADDVLRRWLPNLNKVAFAHGMGISSLYLITPQNQNFDFFLLLNISIAAIVAANATHLTPVISTFKRFFLFLGILKSRHHLAYGRRDVDRSDAEPAVRFCDLPSRVNVACLFYSAGQA
jgi:phosphoglycerol transferase MdoB-like AlkP superfamily enzyme